MLYIRMFKYGVLAVLLLTIIASSQFEITYQQEAQMGFGMDDPLGDDDGTGTYIYPTNQVFVNGAFDLKRFEVWYVGDTIIFKVYVDNLGDNPWNGNNGFSLQYVQIYVHTTAPYPTRIDTYGLNVEVIPGWHFALLINGNWGSPVLPDGQLPVIYYYDGNAIPQGDLFKVYANENENVIIAEVDSSIVIDLEHISNWSYAVFIASYDGYAENGYRVREVQVEASEWKIGGGDHEAIQVGVQPRVMDLLANSSEEQYEMLNSYDPVNNKLAIVNMTTLTLITGSYTPPTPTSTPTSTPSSTPIGGAHETSTPSLSSPTPSTTPTSSTTPPTTQTGEPRPPIKIRSPPPEGGGISPNVLLIVYLALIAAAIIVIVTIIKTIKG